MAQGVQIEFCRCVKKEQDWFLSISVDGIIAAGYIVFTSSYTCTEVSRNRESRKIKISLDQEGVLNIACVISHVYVCSMLA